MKTGKTQIFVIVLLACFVLTALSKKTKAKQHIQLDRQELFNYLSFQQSNLLAKKSYYMIEDAHNLKVVQKSREPTTDASQEAAEFEDEQHELIVINNFLGQNSIEKNAGQSKNRQTQKQPLASMVKKSQVNVENQQKNRQTEPSGESFIESQQGLQFIRLWNHQNYYYTSDISVGNPDSKFNLLVSTGMHYSFIASQFCRGKECEGKRKYDYGLSIREDDMGQRTKLNFPVPGLDGFVIRDRFYLGNLCVKDVPMIEVTKWENPKFTLQDYDGMLGLGISEGLVSILSKISKDKLVSKQTIMVYQNRIYLKQDSDTNPSQILIGGFKQSLLRYEPNWYPIINEKFFTIEFQGILLNGKNTNLCGQKRKCRMGFDSHQFTMTGPATHLQKLLPRMTLTGQNCANYRDLPVLTFVINGDYYDIHPEEYVITVSDDGLDPLYEHYQDELIKACIVALATDYSDDSEFWTMGNLFTSRYPTIFELDYENGHRLGLGQSQFLYHKTS